MFIILRGNNNILLATGRIYFSTFVLFIIIIHEIICQ